MLSCASLLCIFAGGARGAGGRARAQKEIKKPKKLIWAPPQTGKNGFATATLTVNIIGCLLLGWILAHAEDLPQNHLAALQAGFCASLTTFSTFAVDLAKAILKGNWKIASAETLLNAALCPAAVFIGLWAGAL